MSGHDIACGACGAVTALDPGCAECRVPEPIEHDLLATRRRLGLSQAQLARRLKVPADTLAKWERGTLAIRHPEVLRLALERLEQGT